MCRKTPRCLSLDIVEGDGVDLKEVDKPEGVQTNTKGRFQNYKYESRGSEIQSKEVFR